MSIAALFSVLKLLGPAWFSALAEEAKQTPATILGLLFVWVTILAVAFIAYGSYSEDALAAENRFISLETIVAANRTELDCAKDDRKISAKTREINTAARLLTLTEAADDKRELEEQIESLERELAYMETIYASRCL